MVLTNAIWSVPIEYRVHSDVIAIVLSGTIHVYFWHSGWYHKNDGRNHVKIDKENKMEENSYILLGWMTVLWFEKSVETKTLTRIKSFAFFFGCWVMHAGGTVYVYRKSWHVYTSRCIYGLRLYTPTPSYRQLEALLHMLRADRVASAWENKKLVEPNP